MQDTSDNSLNTFTNRKLVSVEFILDYIQLHFDEATITAITWPTIQTKGTNYESSNIEYRNILCDLIGQKLTQVQVIEKDKVLLIFGETASLEISLKPIDYIGAEAVLFRTHSDNQLWVW